MLFRSVSQSRYPCFSFSFPLLPLRLGLPVFSVSLASRPFFRCLLSLFSCSLVLPLPCLASPVPLVCVSLFFVFSGVFLGCVIVYLCHAYSLVCAPALLTVYLRCTYYALLPRTIACTPVNSALCFSPGYYRRRVSRLVSCYALFK